LYNIFIHVSLLLSATVKTKPKANRSGSLGGSQEQPDILETVEIGQTGTAKKSVPAGTGNVPGGDNSTSEVLNKKAIQIVQRVRDKLTGKDFPTDEPIDVSTQVELLIKQATSHENLCQCYIGWCPFW